MLNDNIFSEAVVGQMGIFAIILVIAWLSQFVLGRPFKALERRLSSIFWARQLLVVIQGILLPLLAWILTRLTIYTAETLGRPSTFLGWVMPFLIIWFLYRAGVALFTANMRPGQVKLWSRKVLLPIAIFTGILYGTELLNDFLQLGSPADDDLHNITVGSVLAGLVVIALFFILSRIIRRFLEYGFLPQAGAEPGLAQAISTLVAYSMIIIGAVAGLGITGFDLTTLTVIAGGLSIGLGFGLQQIANNLVSGFILMFERSIGPGDVIELGDTMGTVQNIGIRSLVIRTPNNKEVIIPNSHFLSEMMTNLTRADRVVRVDIKVGVTYNADPLEVEKALLEAAQHPEVLDEPIPSVQFLDFGESSLDFALQIWIDEPIKIPVLASDLRYRIWDTLTRYNIEIPFPQQDIHIRSGSAWPESSLPQTKTSSQ